MPGATTGQTNLPTIVDADDTEQALTVTLTSALQALANLFESATGHDHTGAGKGKPIGSAGIASGVTITNLTAAGQLHVTGTAPTSWITLDSGLLFLSGDQTKGLSHDGTNYNLLVSPLVVPELKVGAGTLASTASVKLANAAMVGWRANGVAQDLSFSFDSNNRPAFVTTAGNLTGSDGGASGSRLSINVNGTHFKIALLSP